MNAGAGLAARPPRWRLNLIFIAVLSALGMGASCDPQATAVPPTVSITVNGIPDDMNDLLVLPPTGFVVNVAWQPGDFPVDITSYNYVRAERWGSGSEAWSVIELTVNSEGTGSVGVFPGQLAPGTYTLRAFVSDTQGNVAFADLAVAVRAFPGAPPIGTGQKIWLDFASDRDATPGPDFPVDLQAFGLGSAANPLVSSWVTERVTDAVVARVFEAYKLLPSNGVLQADPVKVAFASTQPSSGDVTQICIGGEDPTGGITIGSILTDLKNSNRNSVECATLPPTGIFPRELLILSGDASFQAVFHPLMAGAGGVPVGADPLDATVLAPGFDPGLASPEELDRYELVQNAVQVFGDVLGSIVAHETGHALGLVPAGHPGGGLFGGTGGAQLNHAVTPTGADSAENFLMNSGYTFTFDRLAGLSGNPRPYFRPIDYAYLRDRVVIDSAVTVLAFPPVASSITPNVINTSGYTQIFVNGSGFLPTPVIRLLNATYIYNVTGETLISSSQVRGWVNYGQVLPGVYDVELKNPDGQISLLPQALTVPAL
jgi:hypothetical protein